MDYFVAGVRKKVAELCSCNEEMMRPLDRGLTSEQLCRKQGQPKDSHKNELSSSRNFLHGLAKSHSMDESRSFNSNGKQDEAKCTANENKTEPII